MRVVVADIDETSANAVVDDLRNRGAAAIAVTTDVSDRQSVAALADAAFERFRGVHVLHNNAGVGLMTPLDETTESDWQWLIGVNLLGVINAIDVFVPRFRAQRQPAHIVNTSSMSGLVAVAGTGAYSATKFGVVALSESLRQELRVFDVGVSVLCPGAVDTNIVANESRRPSYDPTTVTPLRERFGDMRVLDPVTVGRMVRHGIETNEPYIVTHPELKGLVQHRFDRIAAAFDRAAARDNTTRM